MTADHPNEHAETGFGTGLRAHLGIREPAAPADPEDVVEPAAEPEPEPEPLPVAVPTADDARADALRALERRLEERERELAEEARRLEEARAELERERSRAAAAAAEPALPVRDVLRDRVEREADRLWRTIDSALEATLDDGRPDFHARLAAIKLLLGEAYGDKPAAEALPAREERPEDELAQRRAERFQF